MQERSLTPERWRTTEEILLAAWNIPPEQRDSFLQERCTGNEGLLAELRELVAAQVEADNWVVPGPAEGPGGEAPRAGPFELERLIGRGGMGAVYLAHRADGQFEQKVAVKLIGFPFEIESFRERFRRERQILAGLNHPNITRLLDGGVTANGELYLAMEYVEGIGIDQYCKQPGRSIEERLRLFRQVCGAVQYAHQNLIVHRDIKPSNILVTADGVPKLLDFGTAKLMAEADTTQTGLGLMTTAYASPEQLRGESVTTLSDVFSLGVVLFELLTGQKLFTGDVAARLSSNEPPALPPLLGGELNQILNKSLASESAQRYSSVEQFSEDIRRYLDGEPVLAHPPGLLYRSAKFVRRHSLGVAGAALLLLTIAIGVVTTRQAQLRAERRFSEVRQLANYLVFDIHNGLQRLPGSTALEKQVVERSLKYLDGLAQEASSDQPLRLELAAAYQKLGDVLGNPYLPSLGDRKAALAVYPKALALASSVVTQDPGNLRARQLLASIKLQYGGTQFFGGDREAGKAQVRQAVEDLKNLLAESPDDLDTRLAIARGLTFQASRLQDGGGFTNESDPAEIERVHDQATSHLSYALQRHPKNVQVLRQMAQNELSSGILWGSQNPARAIHHEQEGMRALDQIPVEAQDDVELKRLRGNLLKNIGWAQGQLHEYPDALANSSKAAGIFQSLVLVDPSNATELYQMSGVYRNRGIIRGYDKDVRGAIEDFESAADIHRQLSEKDPANTNYRLLRGELLARIGNLYHSLGQEREAIAKTSAGLGIMKELASAPNAPPSQLMSACGWLAETSVVSLRDAKTAMPFCQRAVERTGGKDAEAWNRLAAAKYLAGDHKDAIATLEKALSMLPAAEAGKPKSRQRQTMEDTLAQWRRAPLAGNSR